MKLLYKLLLFTFHFLLFIPFLTSCTDDEVSKMYSTKHPVNCTFYVPTYTQLFNAMGSYGEFVSIRRRASNGVPVVEMSSKIGTGQYAEDRVMQYYLYGLGGLIAGTNYYGENLAFDLACPNCDRADRRLSIGDAGLVKCGKCGITYDLNNYGVISSMPQNCIHPSPRGLYRYRIMYDGTNIRIFN